MPISPSLYINNTNSVYLVDLYNSVDEQYEPGATVEILSIEDKDGNSVQGPSYPIPMNYVTGSDATFIASLSSSLSLTEGQNLWITIKAETADGLVLEMKERAKVRERKSGN